VEFKENYRNPERVGEYVSALANSAALHGESRGYVLWGIRNSTHELVGTDFVPAAAKKGNGLIEPWLARLLEPQVDFQFHQVDVDGSRVVLLEVGRATRQPVAFRGVEFIRIGSSTRKLRGHPPKQQQLWRVFLAAPFEDGIAAEHLSGQDVLQTLDYPTYFQLLEVPAADGRSAILEALAHEQLILRNQAGGYDITNLGAILFARRLADFPGLRRKAVRLIRYRGSGRMDAEREQEGGKGYASGFHGLAARGQNPPGIRAAMHPSWPLRFACPHCKANITFCHVHYTFCHPQASLCVAPRANSPAIHLSSLLASPTEHLKPESWQEIM